MARRSSFGFFPAGGTDYSSGQEPLIASRLNRLGRSLKLHLIGISGARTPAHSVAVGGFADDPHTLGEASDTPGVESVPEATLRRFGLTRPFGGAAEADHIQLLGWKGGTTTVRKRGRSTSAGAQAADWLKQGGWPRNLIPVMVAIGSAESSLKVDSVGGPNPDGTYDYGWLQINSSHGYDKNLLLTDPVYTSRAGYQIYKTQGLKAWSTYTSGAYQGFMGNPASGGGTFGRTRPGGDSSGQGDTGAAIDSVFADYIAETDTGGDMGNPANVGFFGKLKHFLFTPLPASDFPKPPIDPLKTFNDATKVVKDTGDFLKWIAWIFHPKNILRSVEFLAGITLMGAGLHTLIESYRDTGGESGARRATRRVVQATPVGRATRLAGARRAGKREARGEARATEVKSARKQAKNKERAKQKTNANEREMNRRYGGVPF